MTKSPKLTAATLRIILVALMFVIIAIAGVIFYFGRARLLTVSSSVNQAVADANASSQSLDTYKKIQTELTANQTVVTRAKLLTADLLDYQYQNQIISDLQAYGSQNGVTLNGIDFGATASATPGAAAPTAPATTTPAPAAGGADSGTSTGKVVTITIAVAKGIDYKNVLNFVHAIEQNLPKLLISRLTLTRGAQDFTKVDVSDISIQMYIK